MRLITLLFLALPLWSQPSVVSSTIAQCAGQDQGLTTGTACAGGGLAGSAIDTSTSSLLIACSLSFAGGIGAVTDSKTNSWTALTAYTLGNFNVKMWYAIPSSTSQIGTGHTFTVAGATGNFASLAVTAFKGTQAATALRSSTDTGNSTATNMSVTPVAIHDVIVTCTSDDNTNAKTISGSFSPPVVTTTTTANGETGGLAWLDAPSTSAQTFTWTTSGSNFVQNAAAFEVGAAPAAAASGDPLLLKYPHD